MHKIIPFDFCLMGKPIFIEYARALRKRQTPAEKIMWRLLRNRKFSGLKFLRQHPIIIQSTDEKKVFYIADFYCAQLKFVLEIDGDIHLNQKEYDTRRDKAMNEMGLKVLRIQNEVILKSFTIPLDLIQQFLKL